MNTEILEQEAYAKAEIPVGSEVVIQHLDGANFLPEEINPEGENTKKEVRHKREKEDSITSKMFKICSDFVTLKKWRMQAERQIAHIQCNVF